MTAYEILCPETGPDAGRWKWTKFHFKAGVRGDIESSDTFDTEAECRANLDRRLEADGIVDADISAPEAAPEPESEPEPAKPARAAGKEKSK